MQIDVSFNCTMRGKKMLGYENPKSFHFLAILLRTALGVTTCLHELNVLYFVKYLIFI